MQQLPPALAGLAEYRQFMLYVTRPNPSTGKNDKFPCTYEGEVVSSQDPANWMSAADAVAWANYRGAGYGVAFVLMESDPFFMIDIDGALQPGGNWSPLAVQLCEQFAGCAIEVSGSGKGLHIIGRGAFGEHRKKNTALHIEFYTEGRFIALTGTSATGDVTHEPPEYVRSWLVESYFKPRDANADFSELTSAPVPEWNGPTDDEDLIRRALKSKSAAAVFGRSATFADLWQGDAQALARAFPSESGDEYDRSSADAALASHLSFWTGKNGARMLALMQRSALRREKWDGRPEYLEETILGACRIGKDVCKDRAVEAPTVVAAATAGASGSVPAVTQSRLVDGSTKLYPQQQIDFFKGCVYVASENKVWVPRVGMVSAAAFKVLYGGYTFVMDEENSKMSHDAWDAFTNSRAVRHPVALRSGFWPSKPAGQLVEINGEVYVNTYRELPIVLRDGDVTPFLDHLRKLIPDERDRLILTSYLAALVQYKGTKFSWAPVIQGVPGNGKTFFSMAATYAVGAPYTHWPKASKLGAQFNSWMYGRILYCVEDFGPGKRRDEVIEELKPMITGENLEIEGKGVDQESKIICGNFIFNMNPVDGVRKTIEDRRYAMFYTPQQTVYDLARDGLRESDLVELYDWAKGMGKWAEHGENYGFSVIAKYLYEYPIPPEFNPATNCRRAPATTSLRSAIHNSRGLAEQSIQEAIDEGRAGFRGGFVSGSALKRLLEEIKRPVLPSKRAEVMMSLGYVVHPGLRDGRTHTPVLPDACRTILYVASGTPMEQMRDPSQIAAAYVSAQQTGD